MNLKPRNATSAKRRLLTWVAWFQKLSHNVKERSSLQLFLTDCTSWMTHLSPWNANWMNHLHPRHTTFAEETNFLDQVIPKAIINVNPIKNRALGALPVPLSPKEIMQKVRRRNRFIHLYQKPWTLWNANRKTSNKHIYGVQACSPTNHANKTQSAPLKPKLETSWTLLVAQQAMQSPCILNSHKIAWA